MLWLNAMASCGCRCQDGLVIGNGTTPVNIDEFYYLATVNDTVTDDYGRTFPGNSAFNQSEQSVQCWNDSSSIFVHIIDSCPAYQVCQNGTIHKPSHAESTKTRCTSLGVRSSDHPAVLQLLCCRLYYKRDNKLAQVRSSTSQCDTTSAAPLQHCVSTHALLERPNDALGMTTDMDQMLQQLQHLIWHCYLQTFSKRLDSQS